MQITRVLLIFQKGTKEQIYRIYSPFLPNIDQEVWGATRGVQRREWTGRQPRASKEWNYRNKIVWKCCNYRCFFVL